MSADSATVVLAVTLCPQCFFLNKRVFLLVLFFLFTYRLEDVISGDNLINGCILKSSVNSVVNCLEIIITLFVYYI